MNWTQSVENVILMKMIAIMMSHKLVEIALLLFNTSVTKQMSLILFADSALRVKKIV